MRKARVFVNATNHPVSGWSEKQLEAAKALAEGGAVVDIGFPAVPVDADGKRVAAMARELLEKAWKAAERVAPGEKKEVFIHLGGEASLVAAVAVEVALARAYYDGYAVSRAPWLARARLVFSASERRVEESVNERGETVKRSVFAFQGFRELAFEW